MKIQQGASRGNGVALSCLAELYFQGWSVDANKEKAWKLFQQSAQKGNAAAMHKIGNMYELGIYVDKDYALAMLMPKVQPVYFMKTDWRSLEISLWLCSGTGKPQPKANLLP